MASQGDFLSTYTGLAQDIGNATGLKPEVILGQIAQETGFGDHVKGNNIFGISPGGNVASYPSVQDAATSYINLINSRYPNARAGQTATAQANGLVQDGYNTVDKTYAPKVAGFASTFAPIINQPSTAQPAGDTDSFEKQYGLNGKTSAAPVDTAAPDADFEAKYGLNKAAPAAPAAQAPVDEFGLPVSGNGMQGVANLLTGQAGSLPSLPPAPAQSQSTADRYAGWDSAPASSWQTIAPPVAQPSGSPVLNNSDVNRFLAPAPNTTYGSVLPIAQDNTTGALRLALPGGVRDLAQGVADLIEGPSTGTVTPKATMALAQGMMGGAITPSVASGTGAGIALARTPEAIDAKAAPLPADFKSNPGVTQANPLSAAAPPLTLKSGNLLSVPTAAAAAEAMPVGLQRGATSAVPYDVPAGRAPVSKATVAQAAAPAAEPNAAGAQASTDAESTMTPAEVQANRSVAEIKRLTDSQPEGKDTNQYVPGVTASEAEMEQSANSAREQKQLESAIPQPFKDAQRVNNDARKDYFAQTVGSAIDVKNAIEERSAQAEADLKTAFGNKTDTDAQPVVDTIKGILTDPRDSENTAVQQYVKPFLDRMSNADGTLKSDPEQLYGIREDIARMQSKASRAQTPTLDHVTGQLQQVKDSLDGVIEKGASGYQQYLKNFSDASKPIDTMQLLQEYEPKIVNTNGTMTFSGVKKMMRDIVMGRAGKGLDPAKSIPQETMDKLWNIHDDLRRTAASQELAKARGSDTAQNLMDMVKHGISHVGWGIAHGVAGHASPIVGNIIVHGAKAAVERRAGIKSQAALTNRAAAMANPNPLSYPVPVSPTNNPLSATQ